MYHSLLLSLIIGVSIPMPVNAVSIRNACFAGVVFAAVSYVSLYLYLPVDMSKLKVKKSVKPYEHGYGQKVKLELFDRIGRNIAYSTYVYETPEKNNKKNGKVILLAFFVKGRFRDKGVGTKMFTATKDDIEESFPEIDKFSFLMTPEIGKREALCNFYRKNGCKVYIDTLIATYEFGGERLE